MFWMICFLAGLAVCTCSLDVKRDTQVSSNTLMTKLNYISKELAVLPEIIGEKVDHTREKYGIKMELLKDIKETLIYLKEKLDMPRGDELLRGSGATYVRWGRKSCPDVNGTRKVYDGFAAGGDYRHPGGQVELICLPKQPIWGQYNDATSGGAYVYGTEYEITSSNSQLLFGNPNLANENVPCAVCQSVGRVASLRIPGRTECYSGWTKEYFGFLMAGHYNHALPTDYTCIDAKPEGVQGMSRSQNGRLLYIVEADCGPTSLPCPPYVHGREIPCVICTQ